MRPPEVTGWRLQLKSVTSLGPKRREAGFFIQTCTWDIGGARQKYGRCAVQSAEQSWRALSAALKTTSWPAGPRVSREAQWGWTRCPV
eukprot:4176888-Pyramimonas_sp.AAC.1